jgi:hypothetical protein
MKTLRAGLLLVCLALAGCVPKRETPPRPSLPQQQPQPRPLPPPPAPPPALADWRLMPLTPGAWTYAGGQGGSSQAMFGAQAGDAAFVVRCDRARGQVSLWREGVTSGNMMTVRTSEQARNLPLSVQAGPPAYVWTALPVSDRFLDAVVFSRGRIMVEVPGMPALLIPSWPEPARVLEDCRGG